MTRYRWCTLAARTLLFLLLGFGISIIDARAGIPDRLKWVRGTTACVTTDAITARFRDKALVIGIDGATEVVRIGTAGPAFQGTGPAALAEIKTGEPIEVHYRDSHHVRTARYVWVGVPVDAKTESKGPSTSAAGIVTEVKAAHWLAPKRVVVASGHDRRSFQLPSSAQVPASLQANERVVIVYRQHKSRLTARVVRTIPRS